MVGEVTDGTRLMVYWHGELIVEVPPRSVAHEGPIYHRPIERPAYLDALHANSPDHLPRPSSGEQLRTRACSCWPARTWPTSRGSPTKHRAPNTPLRSRTMPARVDEATGRGVALATPQRPVRQT